MEARHREEIIEHIKSKRIPPPLQSPPFIGYGYGGYGYIPVASGYMMHPHDPTALYTSMIPYGAFHQYGQGPPPSAAQIPRMGRGSPPTLPPGMVSGQNPMPFMYGNRMGMPAGYSLPGPAPAIGGLPPMASEGALVPTSTSAPGASNSQIDLSSSLTSSDLAPAMIHRSNSYPSIEQQFASAIDQSAMYTAENTALPMTQRPQVQVQQHPNPPIPASEAISSVQYATQPQPQPSSAVTTTSATQPNPVQVSAPSAPVPVDTRQVQVASNIQSVAPQSVAPVATTDMRQARPGEVVFTAGPSVDTRPEDQASGPKKGVFTEDFLSLADLSKTNPQALKPGEKKVTLNELKKNQVKADLGSNSNGNATAGQGMTVFGRTASGDSGK